MDRERQERATRDRAADGRPASARPRDGLGRPLPRDAQGVARVPDGLVLPPAAALTEAQRLFDGGLPFHAHEVLEGSWKAASPAERDLWQGLAQLAVGLTHAMRGNASGAAALLRRGGVRIAGYRDNAPYDIDVAGLLAWSDGLVADLEHPPAGPHPPPSPPTLRRTRPPADAR